MKRTSTATWPICLEHGVDEAVVDEVLRMQPVEVRLKVVTAEFAIVGPDFSSVL